MSERTFVKDISEADFETEVIERSHEVPVVVDFWAAWCGPCHALSPVLERLADQADGAWILAKVDVDANPKLASEFHIQGIPAVHAFKDGKKVAEFTGALPEDHVRTWLRQLGPSPADIAFEEGTALEERGDRDDALAAYRNALAHEPTHEKARSAVARLELQQRAQSVDSASLEERLSADPADVEAAQQLADTAAAQGDFERAFELLLDTIASSGNEQRDQARQHLLDLMSLLPPEDARVVQARRSLGRLLY